MLFDRADKVIEHLAHGFLREIDHTDHRRTEGLHLARVHVPNDIRRLCLPHEQHNDRRALSSRHGLQLLADEVRKLLFAVSGRNIFRCFCHHPAPLDGFNHLLQYVGNTAGVLRNKESHHGHFVIIAVGRIEHIG